MLAHTATTIPHGRTMIHNTYARFPQSIQGEIDTAYTHACRVLESAGFDCRNDDHVERLVEEITVYVLESNPDLHSELAHHPHGL